MESNLKKSQSSNF